MLNITSFVDSGGKTRSHPPRTSTRRTAGFTLVELLVVIGIIALLIAILFSSVAQARTAATAVSCLSNLRQVGVGLANYIQTYRGAMPPMRSENTIDVGGKTYTDPSGLTYNTAFQYVLYSAWYKAGFGYDPPRDGDGFLGPFIGTGPNGRAAAGLGCPDVQLEDGLSSWNYFNAMVAVYTYQPKTYELNFAYMTPYPKIWLTIKATSIQSPSEKIYMAEGAGSAPGVYPPHWIVNDFGVTAETEQLNTPTPRHSGRYNAVFVDAHAESLTLLETFIDKQGNPIDKYWVNRQRISP